MTAAGRIILSIDTSDKKEAEKLAEIAKDAGAKYIKMGLELSSATGWHWCSQLARDNKLEWVADAKLDDIPNTVRAAVRNIKNLVCPPFAITMHTTAGIETMRQAQDEAGEIKMLGVTVLTSIPDEEARKLYGIAVRQKVMELALNAVEAGLKGIVCSPQEVAMIKADKRTKGLFAMIPGTRSAGAEHGDQARVATPTQAIQYGANLIVIGRQITQAKDPGRAYNELVKELEGALRVSG